MTRYKQFKKLLEENVQQLDEARSDAGLGAVVFRKALADKIDSLGFNLNYNYRLSRMGASNRFNNAESYDFNNYYTLDIRYPVESLIEVFKGGRDNYEQEFVEKIYNPFNMDEYIYEQLYYMYDKRIKEYERKKRHRELLKQRYGNDSNISISMDVDELEDEEGLDINVMAGLKGKTIEQILSIGNPIIEELYDSLNTVTQWVPPEGGEEHVVIKKRVNGKPGFVDLVMDGLTSAVRGTVPLGVTIEEIIDEKFSRKPVMQDKGAYVNKIKDPTSDKPFSFRAMSPAMLKNVHKAILLSFMDEQGSHISGVVMPEDPTILDHLINGMNKGVSAVNNKFGGERVQNTVNENEPSNIGESLTFEAFTDKELEDLGIGSDKIKDDIKKKGLKGGVPRYCDLVLYMKQEDFRKFEAGGMGALKAGSAIVKNTLNAMSRLKDSR